MKTSKNFLALLLCISVYASASEAPESMKEFNVTCPATKIAPTLDHAYHECSNGLSRAGYDGCQEFLSSLTALLPDYDCQRSFDATPTKNYIVPAFWLLGHGEQHDYLKLLSRMALAQDQIFSAPAKGKVVAAAQQLFTSKEFRKSLDGATAEYFMPLSKKVEEQMKKTHP